MLFVNHVHILVLAALLAACPSVTPDDPSPTPTPDPCAESPAAGTVSVLATDFVGGTEGITFSPDGRLFVSNDDRIEELQPDGTRSLLAEVPQSVGLTFWEGALVVASFDAGLGAVTGGVYRVDIDSGAVSLLTGGIEAANFPAVTPWGTLLVADDTGTEEIVEVTRDGARSTWSAAVPSPNGIGFSADGATAFVATTFGNPAPLWAVPVVDGEAGAPTSLVSWGPGNVPDGLAMGLDGDVWLTQNVGGRVDRIRPGAPEGQRVIASFEGVPWAASVAFGVGPAWDACSLYVTSLFGPDVYRLSVGAHGAPMVGATAP